MYAYMCNCTGMPILLFEFIALFLHVCLPKYAYMWYQARLFHTGSDKKHYVDVYYNPLKINVYTNDVLVLTTNGNTHMNFEMLNNKPEHVEKPAPKGELNENGEEVYDPVEMCMWFFINTYATLFAECLYTYVQFLHIQYEHL